MPRATRESLEKHDSMTPPAMTIHLMSTDLFGDWSELLTRVAVATERFDDQSPQRFDDHADS